MNPLLRKLACWLTASGLAVYAVLRFLQSDAGLSAVEPEPWMLGVAAAGCGWFAQSRRGGTLVPRFGLIPVLAGIWLLPPPASLLPALAYTAASSGSPLWGAAGRPGWAAALANLALTALGGEAVLLLGYSAPASAGRLLWVLLAQAMLTLGGWLSAGLPIPRDALRPARIDAPLAAGAWLFATTMAPASRLTGLVAAALTVAAAAGWHRYRGARGGSNSGGEDWAGLTALRGLLQALGEESPAAGRFKALERTCRKLLELDRFEILLFDSGSATGLSVHRSDGDSLDERPVPVEPDDFPSGEAARRIDLREIDGQRTLTVPLLSRDERVAAVRVFRRAPAFDEREIAWVETAATLAAPELEADRDRRVRHTEPTTGLSTAEHLWTRLEEEARRAQRYKTPLALLWIRPAAGQEHAAESDRRSGKLLARALRDCDLCAQVEEGAFVAVLPDTGRRGATATAARLIERLQVEWAGSQNGPEPSPALGVAVYSPEDGRPPRALALRAEAAALSAAREGCGWTVDESAPVAGEQGSEKPG